MKKIILTLAISFTSITASQAIFCTAEFADAQTTAYTAFNANINDCEYYESQECIDLAVELYQLQTNENVGIYYACCAIAVVTPGWNC